MPLPFGPMIEPDPAMVRTVTVPPARLEPWLVNFTNRHGRVQADHGLPTPGSVVRLTAEDGAQAAIVVPFPPLLPSADLLTALVDHVRRPRRVGAVLVRRRGFAVGVFAGTRLLASKVGSSYVQGRTKAGGWSQQRYARRRDNQAAHAYEDAANEVVRVLLPALPTLEAVATGGDRAALGVVLADPRLADLIPILLSTVHAVPDPRLRVLEAFPEQFLAVEIGLNALA